MNGAKRKVLLVAGLAALAAACDTGPEIGGAIDTPSVREAKITLTPSFDLSRVLDPDLAERIVIEEITINIGDARLLGPDPRIPTGGLALVDDERLLNHYVGEGSLDFEVPEELLSDDLAIYVRMQPTPDLDGAAVVIRGLLLSPDEALRSAMKKANGLSVATEAGDGEAVDPDGDPAKPKGGNGEAVDPDGDPATPKRGEAVDPDGDPADPACPEGTLCSGLVSVPFADAVSFELRGLEPADLVLDFTAGADLDAILNIPAGKWLTPEAVERLERALFASLSQAHNESIDDGDEETIVIEERTDAKQAMERQTHGEERCDDDYSLIGEDGSFDPRSGRPPER